MRPAHHNRSGARQPIGCSMSRGAARTGSPQKATGKTLFAALPNHAIDDGRLTNLDFRVLACIASYDRMSSVRKQGQGSWASHATMAARIGCDYTRFSISVRKLIDLKYVSRSARPGNARQFTYRILYEAADCLPDSKPLADDIVCPDANNEAGIVCQTQGSEGSIVCMERRLTPSSETDNQPQYIPQSGGIDSAEAGKIDSAEAAQLALRRMGNDDRFATLGGMLARLERILKSEPQKVDPAIWLPWLDEVIFRIDPADREHQWALRLATEIDCLHTDDYVEIRGQAEPT